MMVDVLHMSSRSPGEPVSVRCTQCGSSHVRITEEFAGHDLYELKRGKVIVLTTMTALKRTGRSWGSCRRCSHSWQFRKDPLASTEGKAQSTQGVGHG